MSLEDRLQKKRIAVVRRTPSSEVIEQVRAGRKFIVVESEFDRNAVPDGYTLIDMKHRGNSFRTLVPQSLLFYMANPGEGDAGQALDEIADFYGEAEELEDNMIDSGQTSVQEANWATLARGNYQKYLVNRLVQSKKGVRDEDGEPAPEFNPDVLRELNLTDDYVANRVRAIAAVALGKTVEEVKAYGVGDVLKHVTVQKDRVQELTKEEFDRITCWAGSHYEIKHEFRNKDGIEYKIDHVHDRNHKVGIKKTTKQEIEIFDAKIAGLEKEIADYRSSRKNASLSRHDAALIRQYSNLTYIAKENPQAQLDIQPPIARGENGS